MTDYAAAYDAVTNPMLPVLLAAAVGAPVAALAARHHRRTSDSGEPLAPEPLPGSWTSSVVFTCGLCGRPARVPVWAFSHRWLCPACEDIAPDLEQTADELGLPA